MKASWTAAVFLALAACGGRDLRPPRAPVELVAPGSQADPALPSPRVDQDSAQTTMRYVLKLDESWSPTGSPDVEVDGVRCRLVDIEGMRMVVEPRFGEPAPPVEVGSRVLWRLAPADFSFIVPEPPRRRIVSCVPPFGATRGASEPISRPAWVVGIERTPAR